MDLKSKLRQKAVYWPRTGFTKSGQKKFGTAVQIDCHWEDEQQLMVDKNGKEWQSKAKVSTDYPIKAEGILWEGEFKNLTSRTDPFANTDNAEIQQVGKVPSVSAEQKLFCAYL